MNTKVAHNIEMHRMLVSLLEDNHTCPKFKQSVTSQLHELRGNMIDSLKDMNSETETFKQMIQTLDTYTIPPLQLSPKPRWRPCVRKPKRISGTIDCCQKLLSPTFVIFKVLT